MGVGDGAAGQGTPCARGGEPGRFPPPGAPEGGVALKLSPGLLGFESTDGWLVGTDEGEFGGMLSWNPSNGESRDLVQANVRAMLRFGERIMVIEGLSHMGTSHGTVIEVVERSGSLEVELFAELPAAPRGVWIRDGELLIATDVGILSVDTLGNVETHRCYTDEPWRARHATEPRIVASRVRERLSLYRAEVDACFGALPDPKTLPGAPEYHLDASLLLILHRDGTVKEARPRGWGPPGVGRCIAGFAKGWSFPGLETPAHAFEYRFQHSRG